MDHVAGILKSPRGKAIHLVGIKGTGMTALAEMLHSRGAQVTGSDGKEKFYTDQVLRALKIPFAEEFSASHIHKDQALVVHSAAYSRNRNPELLAALSLALPLLSYPEALGYFTRVHESCGISGIHGKTTTTALCGILARAAGLPATILTGSQVPGFADRCTLTLGDKYFLAEACEYRGHFLGLSVDHIIITSVEHDHPDYFRTLEDVYEAFTAYGSRLPRGGTIIYNADDPGACEVIRRIVPLRGDLRYIGYGKQAEGAYRINAFRTGNGELFFSLAGFPGEFSLKVPGRFNIWNSTAALALTGVLLEREQRSLHACLPELRQALAAFTGTRRRGEVIGEAGGILFLDDYGHHPTAIRKTLAGFREFFPRRRLVVDFMPHTYSRTRVLLGEFAACFAAADEVLLNGIYASAREDNPSGIGGEDLFKAVRGTRGEVSYFADFSGAVSYLRSSLQPGDLLVTMGAGDNWKIGREVFRFFQKQAGEQNEGA